MKICTHCRKQNSGNAEFCYSCGNPLRTVIALPLKRAFWLKLPSWAWIIIGLAGIALLLLIIIGGFVGLATVEGFASLLFLIGGILTFRVFSGTKPSNIPVIRAILIGFFALMGATVDQPGNTVYNKPVEWCFCGEGTSLSRTTKVSTPLPGRTDMTQNFTCWQGDKAVEVINPIAVMGLRFLEYVLLAYGLLGLRWMLWRLKKK